MSSYLLAFLSVAFLHFLAIISPGPDFIMVMKNSILYPRRIAVYTALGVSLGIVVHVTYCIFGLAVIISQSILAFNVIKFLGAAYLIYIGVKALLAKDTAQKETEQKNYSSSISTFQAIKQGFLCNALNPKASLFFLGLFTLVVKPTTPLFVQFLYGAWMVFATFVWFAFIATLITHPHFRNRILRIQSAVTKWMGAFLILFGLKLAFTQHK